VTLNQALASGRPMLVVPHAHDQPDNADRARRLGVARIVSPRRYRAGRVAAILEDLLTSPSHAEAAARVGAVVRAEDGVAAACDAIERTYFG
jgi:rhamnosyltransferase subunit B